MKSNNKNILQVLQPFPLDKFLHSLLSELVRPFLTLICVVRSVREFPLQVVPRVSFEGAILYYFVDRSFLVVHKILLHQDFLIREGIIKIVSFPDSLLFLAEIARFVQVASLFQIQVLDGIEKDCVLLLLPVFRFCVLLIELLLRIKFLLPLSRRLVRFGPRPQEVQKPEI